MALLYSFGILVYSVLMRLVALINPKAKKWVSGRKGVFEKLNLFKQGADNQLIAWFHCASLGEFEQGRTLIEAHKNAFPSHQILLTFFSPSGYEIQKNYPHADYICYLPIDSAKNARQFVNLVNPHLAVFVKYEFWYHYLFFLKENKTKIISVSAIFRPSQVFFKWYGGFYRNMLMQFDMIFVQNQASFDLLQSIDIQSIRLSKDTRFDRVRQLTESPKTFEKVVAFKANSKLLVVGSCWAEDFEVILPVINACSQDRNLKFIIAPHEIKDAEIKTWQNALTVKSQRYSDFQDFDANVLFIDNIGMLSSLYQYADFAWIGGAYGKGLHNTLEAATYGMPLFFGNKAYAKFQEALDLLENGCAFSISNMAHFAEKLNYLLDNQLLVNEISAKAKQYVQQNTGATNQIMEYLSK